MQSSEIRKKFLEYFAQHQHTVVPSSSLVPNDPSVLLTTAGMQQFKPYYTRTADPMKDFDSLNTVSIQKCFRTSDIDEVGDESHLTFFEMLGNFSFGGYFKKDAIKYAKEFIESLGLIIEYVTVFGGDSEVPEDMESEKIWKELGIKDVRKAGRQDNFWGPTGNEGPCGPTTEIYINGVEVWNIVFNQYFKRLPTVAFVGGNVGSLVPLFKPLDTAGVDTGMGLERLVMVLQGKKNIFETDLFAPFTELIPDPVSEHHRRVILDHLRGASFLIADGIRPANKGAGYILRRIMRRVLAYENIYNLGVHVVNGLLHDIVHEYGEVYAELLRENEIIRSEWEAERLRFQNTLSQGLKTLESARLKSVIDARVAFDLYQSFGLPFEIIKEVGGDAAGTLTLDAFQEEFKKHQEISRAGIEKKFGGHGLLLDTGELKAKDQAELEKVTRLHSATHLLQAALRQTLGAEVHQMGSDITALRTRFDFSFSRKLTREELTRIERIVNDAIERDLTKKNEEMPYARAVQTGALHFLKEKYPEMVSVYSFVDTDGTVFSRELCGGPHVTHTKSIGKFTILKEEASSSGVRRIRASIEP